MSDKYKILPISEYIDRTTSGFLGQLVGFFSGYEFVFTKDKRAYVAMPDDWFEMCNGPYANPNPHKSHSDKLLFNEESGKPVPASIAFVPSVVGLIVAGEVIKDLIKE